MPNPRLDTLKKVLPPNSTPLTHSPKNAPLIIKSQRTIQLSDTSSIHDANAIIPDDSLQPMRNAQQRLALEASDDGLLDLLVRFEVN